MSQEAQIRINRQDVCGKAYLAIRFVMTLALSLSLVAFVTPLCAQAPPVVSSTSQTFTTASPVSNFRPGLMRIDFSIATSTPSRWQGEIRLSRGSFGDLTPLSVNGAGATSFLLNERSPDRVYVNTRASATFHGFEATLFAPKNARLEISLHDLGANQTINKTVFVERLVDSSMRIPFNEPGAGIEVMRAPADELPARIQKTNVNSHRCQSIFLPNEAFQLLVAPRSLANKPDGTLVLHAQAALSGASAPYWTQDREITPEALQQFENIVYDQRSTPNCTPFNITAPEKAGVFELTLELTCKKGDRTDSKSTFAIPSLIRNHNTTDVLLARRTIQCVVVPQGRQEQMARDADPLDVDLREELLETIDPTNPSWRKNFSKRSILPLRLTPTLSPSANSKGSQPLAGSLSTFASDLIPNEEGVEDARLGRVNTSQYSVIAPNFQEEQAAKLQAQNASRLRALGQAPNESNVANGFNVSNGFNMGMGLFGIGSRSDQVKSGSIESKLEEYNAFIRRWERDEFQTFQSSTSLLTGAQVTAFWDKPLNNGRSHVLSNSELTGFAPTQRSFVCLEPNKSSASMTSVVASTLQSSSQSSTISWEAYPIPIQDVGMPHLLEIEFPASVPQKLGISVLEPNANGVLVPSFQDMGFVVDDDPLSDRNASEVVRRVALFWPHTKTPIVLMANCSSKESAIYGRIRIYRANSKLADTAVNSRGRMFVWSVLSPRLCDQFNVERRVSRFGLNGAEDWRSFDEAIHRLIYYVCAYNYDYVSLMAASDGSGLYPSECLNPTPKFDHGVFLANGGDLEHKDVLGYALAVFQFHQKTLIPGINLNSTLPSLESQLLALRDENVSDQTRASLEGIEWIGIDGERLINSRMTRDGFGPYYNVLHPVVEAEILRIIRELASRCAPYDSFGGVLVNIDSNSSLALPDDPFFGLDDETITRFVRESNLQNALSERGARPVQDLLLAKGANRYRLRAEFIREECLNEWLNWRSEAMQRFYDKIRATVADIRPDVKTFLNVAQALDGPNSRASLAPVLNGQSKLRSLLRTVGLDPIAYSIPNVKTSGIAQAGFNSPTPTSNLVDHVVVMRPEIIATTSPLARTALNYEFTTPEAISLFAYNQAFPSVIFTHLAEDRRLADFDLLSPIRPSYVKLQTLAQPAGDANRKRFARQLAVADTLCFFDGGVLAPTGQEDSLADWLYVYKNLPAIPFKTWTPKSDSQYRSVGYRTNANDKSKGVTAPEQEANDAPKTEEKSIQPLVARYCRTDKETWFYILNAAPFHMTVRSTFMRSPGAKYEIFAPRRRETPNVTNDSVVWEYSAPPFDLVAIRIEDPQASIGLLETSRPVEICGADGRLPRAVQDFVSRVTLARQGVDHPLRNGDFEEILQPSVVGNPEVAPNTGGDKSNLLGLEMPRVTLFKRPHEETSVVAVPTPQDNLTELDPIPGWRVFGTNEIVASLDAQIKCEGAYSLRVSSDGATGGVICQPFEAPGGGRLCAQICFGAKRETNDLPLNVCLTGRLNGRPFNRRVNVGNALLQRMRSNNAQPPQDDVMWSREVVLFDKLPLEGLEDLSLRFELCGEGVVWLDQIKLYKLAFADSEQSELMRMINTVEYRASHERVNDVAFTLDSYWARLLREEIPDDSPQLAERIERTSAVTEPTPSNDENASKETSRPWSFLKFW
ncbi:MAG: hypothetical protein Q4G03_07635 [Planctomycetia bacterium]|nr:hypothetical protein [Planctomycetia bacterium]